MRLRQPSGALVGDSPFLWVVRFSADGSAALAAPTGAPSLALEEDGFLWVHINAADLRYREWVAAQSQIPADARALLVDQDSHQRLSGDEKALWGVLADYGRALERDEEVLRHLRIVVTERFVITARRNAVRSPSVVRQAALDGARFVAPLDLFEALVEQIFSAMDASIDALTAEFNDIEDRVLDDESRDERRHLGSLRRSMIRLHRQLASAQRVLSRLDQSTRISRSAHSTLQRLSQQIDSLLQELNATHERARLLQEEIVSNLSAETNRQLYVLTILGTLLMPPTLISGVFGMNTKNLFFADSENGTIYAALLCLASAAAAYLALVWIRRASEK